MDINISQAGTNFAYQESNKPDLNDQAVEKADKAKNSQTSDSLFTEPNLDATTQGITQVQPQAVDKVNRQEEDVESALSEVSEFVQQSNRNLNFSFDPDSNQTVIKVTDSESGDVIRQIPSEEVIALAERINKLQSDVGEAVGIGVFVNNQV
ncbi:flagellar protein FlaG [Catenovulum sp. SM1970]|uniref:flagellar protein FlaG n=1 Tax=Marinifaba aquimaris TaxID=2741323 RepID=UPI0015723685|nr:flagellar protein FlaG [Marinifaba aquimaris]NTS75388.1 flagellar protein FlaG [Marinifaba aquimaris]